MTDPEPRPGNADNSQEQSSTIGRPRWVKVFVMVALALVVLAVVAMLIVGGNHGPGRHQSTVGVPNAAWDLARGPFLSWNLG